MKITRVSVSVHRIPVTLPIIDRPASDGMRVVCEVETDDGHTGIGMAARFLPHGIAAAVAHHLAPEIIGLDPRDLQKIHARLRPLISERGRMSGINLSALSCIDLALWDLAGKSAGRTVAQLLGGHADEAAVYVTFGFQAYDRDQLVQLAGQLVAAGHTRLKMLVGGGKYGLLGDAERVRHVRYAIGEDILLAIDANESVPLDYALQLTRLIEDCNIAWFEDPLLRNDPRDLARLRSQTRIPLSAGQMDGHAARFREWLEHDALDIFMPNSIYNGGMSETCKVAALADIYNRPLSDAGGGGIFCLHHVAGFHHGTLAEVHIGTDQVERALFADAPEPEGDRTKLPAAPGFGVTLDRDVLADTRVDP